MLTHKISNETGFTLVELLISIVIMGVIGTTFLVFFKSTLFNYLNLQTDATVTTQLDTQSARVATVLRGTTNVSSAAANDLVIYSYFYPSDAYVSLTHYYLSTANGATVLLADVTPMNANPPIGTLETDKEKTYTIISNFYQAPGTTLFTYLGLSGNTLTAPVSDLTTIKAIQINLAGKGSNNTTQTISVQVSLRNKKVN